MKGIGIVSERMLPMSEEDKRRVQRAILPIVATGVRYDHFTPIGTGFVVATLGRRAVMLSAAHNFQTIRKIDMPYEISASNTLPEFRVEIEPYQMKETKMQALFFGQDNHFHCATIMTVDGNKPADVVACLISLEDDIPSEVLFDTKLAIDTTPVEAGQPIVAAGYSNMQAEEQGNSMVIYKQELAWREGKVTEVFRNKGPRNQPYPCFQCDIPFDAGMSGGPILNNSPGVVASARGVISSDMSENGVSMKEGSGASSIACMLWPAMGIKLTYAGLDGQAGVTLLELERRGWIDDKGRASEHVSFVQPAGVAHPTLIWK